MAAPRTFCTHQAPNFPGYTPPHTHTYMYAYTHTHTLTVGYAPFLSHGSTGVLPDITFKKSKGGGILHNQGTHGYLFVEDSSWSSCYPILLRFNIQTEAYGAPFSFPFPCFTLLPLLPSSSLPSLPFFFPLPHFFILSSPFPFHLPLDCLLSTPPTHPLTLLAPFPSLPLPISPFPHSPHCLTPDTKMEKHMNEVTQATN